MWQLMRPTVLPGTDSTGSAPTFIIALTATLVQEHEGEGAFLAHSGCVAAATAMLAHLRRDGMLYSILRELAAVTGKTPAQRSPQGPGRQSMNGSAVVSWHAWSHAAGFGQWRSAGIQLDPRWPEHDSGCRMKPRCST